MMLTYHVPANELLNRFIVFGGVLRVRHNALRVDVINARGCRAFREHRVRYLQLAGKHAGRAHDLGQALVSPDVHRHVEAVFVGEVAWVEINLVLIIRARDVKIATAIGVREVGGGGEILAGWDS